MHDHKCVSYWSQTDSHWIFFKIGGCCYCCSVAKLCPTLCNPMNCSTPGFPCPSPSPWHLTASEGLHAQWELAVGQPRPQVCHPAVWSGWRACPRYSGTDKHGPLEKGMAHYFSILAFRTPWAVWKGQKKHLPSNEYKCGQLGTSPQCEVYTGGLQNWVENILPSRGSLLIYGSVTTYGIWLRLRSYTSTNLSLWGFCKDQTSYYA